MREPLKLIPALKDYLWGGTELVRRYGFAASRLPVAEAWMLSVHPDGESVVAQGPLAGLPLSRALERMGPEALGTAAARFSRFPILIKLIDAKQNLSVQVHPDDAYASVREGEYGKTEMWHVADCEEGAYLYLGFREPISKDEFRRRIADNTLTEVLRKVPVRKGDTFLIPAGTIHAIGAGLLIAEIQQNSNSTYRVYDYGRLGPDGKPRALHIDKALDVTVTEPPADDNFPLPPPDSLPGRPLVSSEYFCTAALSFSEKPAFVASEESFAALLVLSGTGTLEREGGEMPLKGGDCLFLPAGLGPVRLSGDAEALLTVIPAADGR